MSSKNFYGREAFPRSLAKLIAAKADEMARAFESRCIEEMVKDAKRALGRGEGVDMIAKQMGLGARGGDKV